MQVHGAAALNTHTSEALIMQNQTMPFAREHVMAVLLAKSIGGLLLHLLRPHARSTQHARPQQQCQQPGAALAAPGSMSATPSAVGDYLSCAGPADHRPHLLHQLQLAASPAPAAALGALARQQAVLAPRGPLWSLAAASAKRCLLTHHCRPLRPQPLTAPHRPSPPPPGRPSMVTVRDAAFVLGRTREWGSSQPCKLFLSA
jgi:hypothetical protein